MPKGKVVVGQIALHNYLSQIEQLLEENRLAEAASHCHFILQQQPRHIDTYRLFGRALLEQQLYTDATDIFQRVLSADPEDLISHAGLALAYREKRQLARSIWHMERAFEIDPYNRAVRTELGELYTKRDSRPPERLTLTRAGLARLYVKGDMQEQAVEELRTLLDEQPDRIDLQTLLAEALWRADRRVECVEVCQDILDQLPYNIKANAILADIWRKSDRLDEAELHMQRLQALTLLDVRHFDPESVVGRAYLSNVGGGIPPAIMVERLDYLPAEELRVSQLAGWSGPAGGDVPDWLQEMEQSSVDTVAPSETPSAADDEMLDWLRTVAATEAVDRALEGGEGQLAGEDLPSWLQRPVDWQSEEEGGVLLPGKPVDDDEPGYRDSAGDLGDQGAGRDRDDGGESSGPEDIPSPPAIGEAPTDWHDESETTTDSPEEAPKWLYDLVGLGVAAAAVTNRSESPGQEESESEGRESTEEAGAEAVALAGSAEVGSPSDHEQAGANHQTEDSRMGISEEPENGGEPRPEDEENMDWLAELAAQNGIDDLSAAPGGELDGLDWLTDQEPEGPAPEAEWLDDQDDADLTVIGSAAVAGAMAVMGSRDELEGDEGQLEEEVGSEDQGEAEEDLSWLDQIASGEGQAIEEPPTMSWDESAEAGEPAPSEDQDLDEDLSWLEDLVEAEAPAEGSEGLETVVAMGVASAEEETDLLGEVPDDPDEAMAWLEQLAARQGVPVEELPTLGELDETAADQPAPEEEADETSEVLGAAAAAAAGIALARHEADSPDLAEEIPEDPDEAMAWLERLAESEGQPHDELEEEAHGQEIEVEPEELAADLAAGELPELDSLEMPKDSEEALAWLYDLAGAQAPPVEAAPEEEPGVVEEMPTPPGTHDVAAGMAMAKILAEQEIAAEPEQLAPEADEFEAEDIDEAMAWLEQLAADQGTVPEEPPSPVVADEVSSALEEYGWEDDKGLVTEPQEGVETSLASETVEDVERGTLLPAEEAVDELDWLDTIGEVDAEGWLEAEEESSGKLVLEEVDFEAAVQSEGQPADSLEEVPAYESLLEEVPAEIDGDTLSAARSAVSAGDLDQALEAYSQLVAAGEGLPFLIADMEKVLEEHGRQPGLRRLLGDAYSKNGQVQKALEAYRQALDEL